MRNPEAKKKVELYKKAKEEKAEKILKEAEELAREYEEMMEELLEEGKWEEFKKEWLKSLSPRE